MNNSFLDSSLPGQDEICFVAEQFAAICDVKAKFPYETISCAKQHFALAEEESLAWSESRLHQKLKLCYELGRVCSSSSMVLSMHYASWELIGRMKPRSEAGLAVVKKLRNEQALIASLTTEFENSGDITKSRAIIDRCEDGYKLSKKTPICSYLEQADAVMALCQIPIEQHKSQLGMAVYQSKNLQLKRLWDWNAIGMRGTCSHGFNVEAMSQHDPGLVDESGVLLRTILTPASHIFWSTTWFGIFDSVLDMATTFMSQGKSASPAAMKQASARLEIITHERNAILKKLNNQISRYIELERGDAMFVFRDTVEFNDLKVNVSERLSHNLLDLITILGTRYFSNPEDNSAWRKFRDLSSSMFMISNDLINGNSSAVRRLAGQGSRA